jgi:hypothetical protein
MDKLKNAEILRNARIGVEFEFYSDKSIKQTAKEIGSLLSKRIRIEDKAHSDFVPTDKEFKIEPDMSGGQKLMELVTGSLPYSAARLCIIRVSQWINENGYTDDRSSIHLNISFENDKGGKHRIEKMNVLKFILDFDEKLVFEIFPKRENSTYAKSIKFVIPNEETFVYEGGNINSDNFIFPNSKYYGINFEKRIKNYLEFRYIGGKNWDKKTNKILYLLDNFIVQLWNSTKDSIFTDLNKLELKKVLSDNSDIIESRSNWKNIEKKWKNIEFTVDFHKDPTIIDLYWDKLKRNVIRLFTHGSITKGHINYDSDTGRLQIKDGELSYCVSLEGYDFVDCNIKGEFSLCDVFGGTIENSDVKDCNFYNDAKIVSSKLKSCYINRTVLVKDSYIYGNGVMKGNMEKGIFREGRYDKSIAKFNGAEKIKYVEI